MLTKESKKSFINSSLRNNQTGWNSKVSFKKEKNVLIFNSAIQNGKSENLAFASVICICFARFWWILFGIFCKKFRQKLSEIAKIWAKMYGTRKSKIFCSISQHKIGEGIPSHPVEEKQRNLQNDIPLVEFE